MSKSDAKKVKKYFGLTTIGILFQILGSLCIIIASLRISKEINIKMGQFFAEKMKKSNVFNVDEE